MKAQLFSGDMIAAVFLFLLVSTFILFSWNSSIDVAAENLQRREMELAASRILDIMVKSPGYPANWEAGNASVIGLAGYDRTIDPAKLNAFINMDYNRTKEIFGIGDYFFRLGNYTKGTNGTNTVFVRRMVIFNGSQLMELSLSR